MTLYRTIYSSRPFGFNSAMLGGILVGARRNNRRDGLTGALICRADLYLQLLEGPEPAVEAALARIERDDRHVDVERLVAGTIPARLFPAWDMLDDPARSWLWSVDEVANGALAAASPAAVSHVFERLAAEQKAPRVDANGLFGGPACPVGGNA
ncbi:MAG: BLUF domain-containing protein [Sphingomonadaceae bacterium]|nr:BLUF domain-containing protein [Sphingomonadaceae bacterium]